MSVRWFLGGGDLRLGDWRVAVAEGGAAPAGARLPADSAINVGAALRRLKPIGLMAERGLRCATLLAHREDG